ncbi:cobalamin-binding protein [Alkalimonas collagenimarina]|uniref:Cobalamin-binding protein n=1 Tax=Alkalimonas collagenimarina TaxID=400390 RepID=A0ABT9H2U3_9GAMM|nr:cobalamin-binding protein [Alkalimonas collagenimarina]MDP4537384.1 cobalamin-binding protein [Alkalimonas collagenimarina]
MRRIHLPKFGYVLALLSTLMLLPLHAASSEPAPQRIIALAPHIVELLFDIGAGDQLVAVSDHSDYPAIARELPRVANYAAIQLEAVLSLQPDLVIAWRSGNPAADLQRLAALGVRIEYSDPKQLADVATELRYLGELTGHVQQAEQQAQRYEQELARLEQQYQQHQPVRVFFASSTQPLSTVANQAWPQQMLELCGAENPFADVKGDYPTIGPEQLLLAQPELIIVPSGSMQAINPADWTQFARIPAVQNQQFLQANADYLYRFTRRSLLGIKQLCQGIDDFRQTTALTTKADR